MARGPEITGATTVHRQGLVAAAKEVSKFLVSAVIAAGVSAEEPLHAGYQVGLVRLNYQMKVIVHQVIGVHLPAGLFARLAQRLQKPYAIRVVRENHLTAVAAVHNVVHCPGIPARGACEPWLRFSKRLTDLSIKYDNLIN